MVKVDSVLEEVLWLDVIQSCAKSVCAGPKHNINAPSPLVLDEPGRHSSTLTSVFLAQLGTVTGSCFDLILHGLENWATTSPDADNLD